MEAQKDQEIIITLPFVANVTLLIDINTLTVNNYNQWMSCMPTLGQGSKKGRKKRNKEGLKKNLGRFIVVVN